MTDAANKHTPGPWHVDDDDGTILSEDGSEVFASHCSGDWHYIEALPADRRLIAAAPDLLAACEAAHLLLIFAAGPHEAGAVPAMLRDAIAKAKGEKP